MTIETNNDQGLPPVDQSAGLVGRAKRIIMEPKAEWDRIDAEPATVEGIYKNYVVILAALPVLAGLIGALAFGYSAFGVVYRPTVGEAVMTAIGQYVGSLLGVYLLALVIDWLAPKFGGVSNRVQAVKVAAYSATAGWLAGIFSLLPALSFLGILGVYSLYLLYLGLPRLMKAPEDKAVGYTVVTIVAAVVLVMVISAILSPIAATFS